MDSSAAVAVTEANVEKVLLDCDDEPFPEVAYSLDDIRWASCASQAEIDASGLVGVTTGGLYVVGASTAVEAAVRETPGSVRDGQNSARKRSRARAGGSDSGSCRICRARGTHQGRIIVRLMCGPSITNAI